MKAGKRLKMMAFAAGLVLGTPLLAQGAQTVPQNTTQSNPAPPTTTPPSRTIGPQQLQNFSIGGTVTRPSDTPPARINVPPVTTPNVPATSGGQPPSTGGSSSLPRTTQRRPAPATVQPSQAPAVASKPAPPATGPGQQVGTPSLSVTTSQTPATPVVQTGPATVPSGAGSGQSLVPWILAAIAAVAAGAFLWWRRRPREALAAGYTRDSLDWAPASPPRSPTPPVPEVEPPAPVPVPVPVSTGFVTTRLRPTAPAQQEHSPVPPANPLGIVSTRLRPWLDVSATPVSCRVEDQLVTLEFQVEVLNSGGAPARDIRFETLLFNAGPDQDQALSRFMSQAGEHGDAIDSIAPLQRIAFRSSLQVQRASVEIFDLGGRQLFVPVMAFNATYRWSGGVGQTSGSYLLGRDTGAEKLAPLRADVGPRAYGGLGGRPLEIGVRR